MCAIWLLKLQLTQRLKTDSIVESRMHLNKIKKIEQVMNRRCKMKLVSTIERIETMNERIDINRMKKNGNTAYLC